MKEERKFTFVGRRGIKCNICCFDGGSGPHNFRLWSNDYGIFLHSLTETIVGECSAPNAPGKNSKLGRRRICVMSNSDAERLCERDLIQPLDS